MPALPRYTQKVFGGDLTPTGNVAVYGSLAAGAPAFPDLTSNLAAIQALAGWGTGLNGGQVGNRSPAIQDLNGLFVVLSQQIAYLLQNGLPEWDAGTTYFIGQMARLPGTAAVATSLTDNNLANDPATDTNNWSISGSSFPAVAATVSSQTINVGDGPVINFANEQYDPQNCYNPTTSVYTVPVAGAYLVTASLQVDNVSGRSSTMELSLVAAKNGAPGQVAGMAIADPPGQRWYPSLSAVVVCAAGDALDIRLNTYDTINTGQVYVSNSNWSIHKLP